MISFKNRKLIIATHIGLVVTRNVLLETGIYSKDIIHVRKCEAKKIPAKALLTIVSAVHCFTLR
jgi:hypothetical protein